MPAQASKQAAIEPLDPKSAVLEMTQVVENKKRNLEKRKLKLDVLMAKPETELTEQQKEAISHMGEVNGNIMYVGEILQRFREIQAQVDKWIAIEAKKEKQANKRNKQNAVQSTTSDSTSQRTEPVVNGHATSNGNGNGNEASADITPRSRGSICDPSGTNDQPIVAEPGQAAEACDPASDLIAPLASVVIVNKTALAGEELQEQQQAPSEAAAPIDDAAPNDDEGVPLKETVTFVNSAAESTEAVSGMQPVRGRSAPRRGNRGYYDGPPRDGYGPRYGRPPRRGGPYRGPRGGPHAPPSNRPPVAASAGAAN